MVIVREIKDVEHKGEMLAQNQEHEEEHGVNKRLGRVGGDTM